jgi:hypothetical protein
MVIQYNKVNGGLTCHHRHTRHCHSLPQLGCGLSILRRLLPPSLGGDLVKDLSLVFFVPDLRRIICEGEISRGFLGKGKKSIDLESVVGMVTEMRPP